MWVIRAGREGEQYDYFVNTKKVYLAWKGYRLDLHSLSSNEDFRAVVSKEKGTSNRTSISNWAGQLFAFVSGIKSGDYALVPSRGSQSYTLVKITSNYNYDTNPEAMYCHYRSMEIIEQDIPKGIFTQQILYSLRAYRTIFICKYDDEIMRIINKWKGEHR